MKGIQRSAQQAINYDDFLRQLHEPTSNVIYTRRIGQSRHNLFSIELNMQGLCAFEDKRYLLPDGVNTLAHGHHKTLERFKDLLERAEQQLTKPEWRARNALIAHRNRKPEQHSEQANCVLESGERVVAMAHKTAAARSLLPRSTVHEKLDEMAGCDPVAEFTTARNVATPLEDIVERDGDESQYGDFGPFGRIPSGLRRTLARVTVHTSKQTLN